MLGHSLGRVETRSGFRRVLVGTPGTKGSGILIKIAKIHPRIQMLRSFDLLPDQSEVLNFTNL